MTQVSVNPRIPELDGIRGSSPNPFSVIWFSLTFFRWKASLPWQAPLRTGCQPTLSFLGGTGGGLVFRNFPVFSFSEIGGILLECKRVKPRTSSTLFFMCSVFVFFFFSRDYFRVLFRLELVRYVLLLHLVWWTFLRAMP